MNQLLFQVQDLREAVECANAASAESRATAVALNQRLAEAVAARRAAEAAAAASNATAEALQHRVRALELAAKEQLEEISPKPTDVSSHERCAVELETRLVRYSLSIYLISCAPATSGSVTDGCMILMMQHELRTQLDARAAGYRQLEEVLTERTAELAQAGHILPAAAHQSQIANLRTGSSNKVASRPLQVRDDAQAMEQQQSQTHAELDQCRLLTRQLETRVEAAAADCRNLELSAQDRREAVLQAEQHAAEQAQRHEAVSSQLKQALAEAASSHAAEIVSLETRVSGACAAQHGR